MEQPNLCNVKTGRLNKYRYQ